MSQRILHLLFELRVRRVREWCRGPFIPDVQEGDFFATFENRLRVVHSARSGADNDVPCHAATCEPESRGS